jgi:hypothetical protein
MKYVEIVLFLLKEVIIKQEVQIQIVFFSVVIQCFPLIFIYLKNSYGDARQH